MTRVSEAMAFAAQAHDGMLRKGTALPYIVHPAEVVAIAATLTHDEEVLAAAVLHDVMEDCGVSFEEISTRFGERVARLVLSETQVCAGDPRETWDARKSEALVKIAEGDRAVKTIALADKLSNMRAIRRDYERDGDAMFYKFHQRDVRRHAWYYASCVRLLEEEFADTGAFRELHMHVKYVFGSLPFEEAGKEGACAV